MRGHTIHCKLECENSAGSHKDRPARWLLTHLRSAGRIGGDGTRQLLVSSSGNFAKAIAYHSLGDKVEIVVVTDVLSPHGFIEQLSAFPHVHVHVVDEPDSTGSHLAARLRLVDQLLKQNPDMIFIDQYKNPLIPEAYEKTLGPELTAQIGGEMGAVFLPIGTGGTLNGLIHHRANRGGSWSFFAVDAEGSGLFRPPLHGAIRTLSGYGNGRPTNLLEEVHDLIDHVVFVTDVEAISMCRRMHRTEGLCIGPSAGATLAAFEKTALRRPDLLPSDLPRVAILPDRGDVYTVLHSRPARRRRQPERYHAQAGSPVRPAR